MIAEQYVCFSPILKTSQRTALTRIVTKKEQKDLNEGRLKEGKWNKGVDYQEEGKVEEEEGAFDHDGELDEGRSTSAIALWSKEGLWVLAAMKGLMPAV